MEIVLNKVFGDNMKNSAQSESLSKNGGDALQAAIDDGWNLNLSREALLESELETKRRINSERLRYLNILSCIGAGYLMLIGALLLFRYRRYHQKALSRGGK